MTVVKSVCSITKWTRKFTNSLLQKAGAYSFAGQKRQERAAYRGMGARWDKYGTWPHNFNVTVSNWIILTKKNEICKIYRTLEYISSRYKQYNTMKLPHSHKSAFCQWISPNNWSTRYFVLNFGHWFFQISNFHRIKDFLSGHTYKTLLFCILIIFRKRNILS